MQPVNRLIATLLIVQLLFAPCDLAWSQLRGGKKPVDSATGPLRGRGAPAVQSVVSPGVASKPGVSSASMAEDVVPGGQALSRAISPDYVLGPGDSLAVSIWGEYEDKIDTRVAPDGKISVPIIGMLTVKGFTLGQAHELIEKEIKKYYHNVKTGVSLTALRVFEVSVLGYVSAPGTYLATPVKHVSDVIAQAGGVLAGGSQRFLEVQRNGRVFATADLVAFDRKGDQSANPALQDGDIIFVPSLGDKRVFVYVSEVATQAQAGAGPGGGALAGPGGGALTENSVPYVLEMREGDRLSDVINQLGGISAWWDLESVFIERSFDRPEGTMRIPVNLQRYFLEKDESQNLALLRGDQVYIPALTRRVFVTGAVRVPEVYTYLPGRAADSYLAQAGGASLAADFDRSFVKRVDGSVVSYREVGEVENGDTIVVVEKIFKTWQDYFALVGTVSGVILGLVGFYAEFTNFGR